MAYELKFRSIWKNMDMIWEGVKYTLLVSLIAVLIGILLGIVAAACRTSRVKVLSVLATAYIEAIRNTPLLVQLWLFYFGLTQIGINLPALTCGIMALGINSGAYAAEIIRAGLESVDQGILDAGASLGFTNGLILRKIKIPLAIRAVLPSLGNNVIQCLLASSLLSVLGINELTNQALRLSSKTYRTFESFIVIAVLYVFMTFAFLGIIRLIKKLTYKGSLH
ncbi:MAG: amino acid ABC transporter permease [Firmicutes bacterium]|nr:amino acid ABC transporter permease [Bacillota bacterium]